MDNNDGLLWVHKRILPRFSGDPESKREAILHLREILTLKGPHRPQRWGFVFIRTAYGPGTDEQLQHAVALIHRIAQVYYDSDVRSVNLTYKRLKTLRPWEIPNISLEVDTRADEEILRRFENDVIEGPTLADASVAAVRDYFTTWTAARGISGTRYADTRFNACILLDAETLAQLADVPEDVQLTTSNSPFWVKMVEATTPPEDAFHVAIFGNEGLALYWFHRNYCRQSVMELISRREADHPAVCYYGTRD
ncbi:hypothetical protein ACJ41O_011934 [Fusarium nematophilum]